MDNDESSFPRALLKRSAAERLSYFNEYSVAHTVLEDSFEKIMQTIRFPAGIQILFVIGPPRAGKTHLMEWVTDVVREMWAQEQHTNRGRIPVVGIEVPSKDRVSPSCADIYHRLLVEMAEPLIDRKITFAEVTIHRDGNDALRFGSKGAVTTTKYRYALENAIHYRQPIFIALDEGQHLLEIGGLGMDDIMDWLKSMANMTKTLIILFGTYEMDSLLDLSDQLMCRSRIIHLRRYRREGKDRIHFQATIQAFQKNMPFPDEPDLLQHWEYLYERTAGCVGNLRNWLLGAYSDALDKGQRTLSLRHLQKRVPLSLKRAATMNANILADENRFYEKVGKEEEITDKSDVPDEVGRKRAKAELMGGVTASRQSSGKKQQVKKRTRVGERNPVRDKTGRRNKAA